MSEWITVRGVRVRPGSIAEAMLLRTAQPLCPQCNGPTIPPDPTRPEEHGDYCEACGIPWDADGSSRMIGRCCREAVEVTPISTKAMYQVTRIESGFPTLIMRFSALTAIATSPC